MTWFYNKDHRVVIWNRWKQILPKWILAAKSTSSKGLWKILVPPDFNIFLLSYCSGKCLKKSYCLHSALQATKANSCETTESLKNWSLLLFFDSDFGCRYLCYAKYTMVTNWAWSFCCFIFKSEDINITTSF